MKKIIFLIALIILVLITLRTNAQEPCQGCLNNEECIEIGSQATVNNVVTYCSIEKQLVPVKGAGQSCQNNFECLNNFCSYSKCGSSRYQEVIEQKSLMQQIKDVLLGISPQQIPPSGPSTGGSSGGSSGSSGGSSGGGSSRSCTSNWQCTEFSKCVNNIQSRSCIDIKGCNKNPPVLQRSCGIEPVVVCNEAWQCTETWSDCIDGKQERACIDLNACGTETSKPVTSQTCQIKSSSKTGFLLVVIGIIILISFIYLYFVRFKQR